MRDPGNEVETLSVLRLPCQKRGRRPTNYMDTVARNTQQEIKNLPNQMSNKDSRHGVVDSISVGAEE